MRLPGLSTQLAPAAAAAVVNWEGCDVTGGREPRDSGPVPVTVAAGWGPHWVDLYGSTAGRAVAAATPGFGPGRCVYAVNESATIGDGAGTGGMPRKPVGAGRFAAPGSWDGTAACMACRRGVTRDCW